MGVVYRVHYTSAPIEHSLPPLGGSLTFAFGFLGALFPTLPACTVLGVLLVAGFIFLLTRGWARLSPDTFCIALFCLLTAAAITPARYSEGVQTAMTSRYRMYPLILLSAEYLAVLRIFVPQRLQLRSIWTALLGLATCAAIAFGVSSQMQAYRNLHARQRLLITHLILWERHPERLDLIPNEFGYLQGVPLYPLSHPRSDDSRGKHRQWPLYPSRVGRRSASREAPRRLHARDRRRNLAPATYQRPNQPSRSKLTRPLAVRSPLTRLIYWNSGKYPPGQVSGVAP